MNVYVFTKKESGLKNIFPKNTQFTSISKNALSVLSKHKPDSNDLSYIDLSGFTNADIKKTLIKFKAICKDTAWGIIDPKGSVADTASLFFDGASDYMGPSFFKNRLRLDTKRHKSALSWRNVLKPKSKDNNARNGDAASIKAGKDSSFLRTGVKLPSESSFPGWKKIRTGTNAPFYLLYCSLQGNVKLDARFGDKGFAQIYQKFIVLLNRKFQGGDGLCWMNTGKDCVFLLPAKAKNVTAVVETCIRMIVSAPLFVMEALNLTIPVNFVFALHYGTLKYLPPGKTGTVVSDAVNFIFHLGNRKAESGRITISSDVPDGSVPKIFEDFFVPAGEFESRRIWHTKKFSYAKPWL